MKTFSNKFLSLSKKFGSIFLLAVFASCSVINSAYGLSPDQKKLFKQNINYFNIDACSSSTNSSSDNQPTSGVVDDTYILGDSITERAANNYKKSFQDAGASITIDASVSRGLNTPGLTGNKLTGMKAIENDRGDIAKAKIVIIALGTNGGNSNESVGSAIDAIRKANKNNPAIYWIDTIAVGRPDEASFNNSIIKPGNKAIYDQSATDKKDFKVISWYNAVNKNGDPENPENNPSDPNGYIDNSDHLGVHPTDKGASALANLVTDSLSKDDSPVNTDPDSTQVGSEPNGCCSASDSSTVTGIKGKTTEPAEAVQQVVWNTLTGGGIDDIHAAAVMGNIAHEGVWNPKNVEDSTGLPDSEDPNTAGSYGYGLIGWTPGNSLLKEMNEANISGPPYTAETQAAVILAAIEGKTPSYYPSSIGKQFLGTQNIDDATEAYQGTQQIGGPYIGFERPADEASSLPDRKSSAKEFLQKFGGNGAPADDSSATSASACACSGGTTDFGDGTLPAFVPKPYNAIFTAAANKNGIAPGLLAAVFYGGEHGSSWPDPPPPYGHGGPWATSTANAQGPFQFIPSTWTMYGQDGNGDGKKDVQDLADGAFGAANYLHASGARGNDENTFHDAIYAYNHAEWYVDQVMVAYHKIIGDGSGSPSTSPSGPTATGPDSSGCAPSDASVAKGSVAELAKKLLSYRDSGQYKCDAAGDCADLEKSVDGQPLAGTGGCQAQSLDPRVIKLLLYIIENGKFKVGTSALCSDHNFDSPHGHSGGFAVDIDSVNGAYINQDTAAARDGGLKLDKFLNNLPSSLHLRQQISWGYGEHYYKPMADTQQADGSLCNASCVTYYTLVVEQQHMNHIHAGF